MGFNSAFKGLKGLLEYTPEFAVSSDHYWHNTFQLAADSLKGSCLVMRHSVRQWAKCTATAC